MFSKQVTTVCLLVVYGLPAIVGPYWHQHGHSFADCEHHSVASLELGKDSKSHRFCSSGGNCCCRHHSSSQDSSTNSSPAGDSSGENPDGENPDGENPDGDETDHRGHCTVCGFYAKAYFAAVAVELSLLCVSLPLGAEPAAIVSSLKCVAVLARGPPSNC